MPREVWSVEIQADITTALSQLQNLRSQIMSMGTKGTAIKPTFDASGIQKGVNSMNQSLDRGRKRATTFIEGIKEDFGSFGRILASRIAFSIATTIQRVIVGAILLIPKAMGAAIKAGAEFEQSIKRTATVAAGGIQGIDGIMTKLGATARQVGADTTFTAVEVATAMFELVSVGLTVVETQEAIAASAELAVAVQTDLTTAIDITTQIMKAFGLNSSELTDIGDKLTFAIDNTTLNVSRLQAALRFAAPAAGALGVSFDDMLTVVAKFVDVTKQGGISGRAFRFMISRLAKPTAEAKGVLEKLGLTVREVNPKFNDLTDIMNKFARTTLDGTDALAIFGKRAGGTVAGAINDVRLSLATGVDSLNEFKDALTNAARNDLAAKQAAEFMNTLASKFKIFVSKITELGLQIFDVIGPFVIKAQDGLNLFLDALIAISPQLKTFFKLLVAIVAVRIASALVSHAGAMKRFVVQTIFGNKALKTHAALLITTQAKTGKAAGSLAQFGLGFGKLSKVLSKVVPLIKRFAGGAGVLLVITGFIEWARRSVVIQHAIQGIGNWIAILAQKVLDFISPGAKLKQVWADLVELTGLFINQGLDFFIASLIDLFGVFASEASRLAKWFGILGDESTFLDDIALNAFDTADAMRRMSESAARAAEESAALADEQTRLKTALSQVINSVSGFREMEVAIVNSFNNMIEAGESQKDAINLLAEPLLNLFNNAELVSGEYSNSLLPIMKAAEIQLKLTGEEAETAAEKMERLDEAFAAIFGTSVGELTAGLADINEAMDALGEGGELTVEQYDAIVAKLNEMAVAAKAAGVDLDGELGNAFINTNNRALKLADEGLKRAREEMEEIEEIAPLAPIFDPQNNDLITTQDLATAMEDFKKKLAEAQILAKQGLIPEGFMAQLNGDLETMGQLILDSGGGSAELRDEWEQLAATFGFVRNENEAFEAFVKRVNDSAEEATDSWDGFFKSIQDGIGKAIGELIVKGKSFKDVMTGLLKGFSGANIVKSFGVFTSGFKTARKEGKGFTDSLQGGIDEFRKTLDGPMNAAILGVGAAMGGWQDVGLAALSAISNFAKGDWIAGIMASVGALVGAFKNLFGGTNATKELKKLGLSISEGLTKKIEEAEKALGDYGAAIRTNLAGIIAETGINSIQELNKFLGMQRALLSDLDRGLISSSQAMDAMNDSMGALIQAAIDLNSPAAFGKVIENLADVIIRTTLTGASAINAADAINLLNDQFGLLTEAATQFGPAGLEAMRGLIEGARAAGLEVGAISDFVISKSKDIINSIKDLVGSGMDLTAEQVQFAARAMSVAFAEMRASGASIPEIIDAMGDSIQKLRKRANELGIELPQSFRLIAGLGRLMKNEFVKPQLDGLAAIEAAFQSMIALGLKPTQQDFNVLTNQAKTAFDTMIEQGASGKRALMAIGPTLVQIRDNAAQFGLTIDANTQRMIDQAERQGIIAGATMSDTDIMKTGFENIGLAINRLIETMGGVPVALKSFGDEAVKQGKKMKDEMKTTGDVIRNDVVGGIEQAKLAMGGLGSIASEQMGQFRNASAKAVEGSLSDFKRLRKRLVGNTIIRDISEKGSEFMQEWGDNTGEVVVKVAQDFQSLKNQTVGADSDSSSGVLGQIPQGILDTPGLPRNKRKAAGDIEAARNAKREARRASRREDRLSLRIDIGGREVKNLIVETVAEESRDGRMVVDENSVRETGK